MLILARHPDNQSAIDAVNNFARELAARFSPIVGCTRSWDSSDPTDFQVSRENLYVNLLIMFITGHHRQHDEP